MSTHKILSENSTQWEVFRVKKKKIIILLSYWFIKGKNFSSAWANASMMNEVSVVGVIVVGGFLVADRNCNYRLVRQTSKTNDNLSLSSVVDRFFLYRRLRRGATSTRATAATELLNENNAEILRFCVYFIINTFADRRQIMIKHLTNDHRAVYYANLTLNWRLIRISVGRIK